MKRKMVITISIIIFISLGMSALAGFAYVPSQGLSPHTYQILKAEFHAHTTYSTGEGQYTPTQLVDLYKSYGYDVLAIADHNTVAGYPEAKAEGDKVGLTVICGEQVSDSWPDGDMEHMVGLFLTSTIVSTYNSTPPKNYFDAIHAQGGIGIVAHAWLAWSDWQSYVQSSWIDGWESGMAFASQADIDSMKWLYSSSYIYVTDHDFADSSQLSTLTTAWTLLLANNNTAAGVRDALQSGRVVVHNEGCLWGSPYALSLFIQNQGLIQMSVNETYSPPPQPSPSQVVDSYPLARQNDATLLTAVHPSSTTARSAGGQCFTAQAGYKLTSIQFALGKIGNPTGNLVAVLYALTGTFGTNGRPTGAALATSNTVAMSSVDNYPFAFYTFTFPNPYTLAGGNYCIAIQVASGTSLSGTNCIMVGYDNNAPTHPGNYFIYANGWKGYYQLDGCFSVTMTP